MRLVIIDGLDGVGKDTHGELIAQYYKDNGEKVVLRSHPAVDNYFGRKAKEALFHPGKMNKLKASVFYMLDVLRSIRRYYHPNKKGTLIMVRYLMGTAYLPRKLVQFGYTFFSHFVPTSPYMFFLDASSEEILNRIRSRAEHEIFETYEALEKVRKKAMLLLDRWYIIDTSGSVDDTFAAICLILSELDIREKTK